MRGRFGWLGTGVLLLGIVSILAIGFVAFASSDMLARADADKTDRAVEPTGAKKDPPKAVREQEKEEPKEEPKESESKKEEPKKEEPDEELNDQEQAQVAEEEPVPASASTEATASASAEAPEEASASASAEATAAEEATAGASTSASAEASAAPADTTMSLSVPSIGLSTTVYEGASEASLSAGTGHLNGTGYPWIPGSNTYVAGHRIGYPGTGSDHVFWDLPSVAIGDPVTLTDANGRSYEYAVSEILEVPITDLSVTAPVGEDVVSLQTCIEDYGDYWSAGPNWNVRYVVRATRV